MRSLLATIIVVACFMTSHCADAEDATTPMILAHYMPWFTIEQTDDASKPKYGFHWTMNHVEPSVVVDDRHAIAAHHYPIIGPYDSGDLRVIEYHLLTMKAAGIDGVIVDWYGLTNFRDYARLNRNTTRVLQQCERLGMKFVICYEDQTVPALVEGGQLNSDQRVQHVVDELTWLSKYWFKSPAYVRQNDEPVLLSFGFGGLKNEEWTAAMTQLKFPVRYFSQHIRREGAVGAFNWPSPKNGIEAVDNFITRAEDWPQAIPVVYPRFEDYYAQAKLHDGFGKIDDRNGRTFRATFAKATKLSPSIIQIATWNDWGEGTQIEPSTEFGYRDLEYLQSQTNQHGRVSPDDIRLAHDLYRERAQSEDSELADTALNDIATSLSQSNYAKAKILLNRRRR